MNLFACCSFTTDFVISARVRKLVALASKRKDPIKTCFARLIRLQSVAFLSDSTTAFAITVL